MSERLRVGVVGASGFLGGEVVRLLAVHPRVALTARVAHSSAGRRLSEVRPGLVGPADGLLQAYDADALAEACDLVVLGLPHGASAAAIRDLRARDVAVIDLGSDVRLKDPAAYPRWYGREAGAPDHLAEAWYGLPELTGPPPAGVGLIANPGCFATALALLLAPLVGRVDEVPVFGVTGSSGSGIAPKPATQHTLRATSFTAYKALRHQHLGEVLQLLGRFGAPPTVRFVPHSLPVPRGIHLTAIVPRAALPADVSAPWAERYAGAALVDVVEGPVPMGAVVGSVRARIGVEAHGDDVAVYAAIDNLLKGGSGQAVQNLNLRQGWEETLGLPVLGSWP